MNELTLVLKPRPQEPWTAAPGLAGPEYFDLLIDGLPLWEHLAAAGKRNGFEYWDDQDRPRFWFRPGWFTPWATWSFLKCRKTGVEFRRRDGAACQPNRDQRPS